MAFALPSPTMSSNAHLARASQCPPRRRPWGPPPTTSAQRQADTPRPPPPLSAPRSPTEARMAEPPLPARFRGMSTAPPLPPPAPRRWAAPPPLPLPFSATQPAARPQAVGTPGPRGRTTIRLNPRRRHPAPRASPLRTTAPFHLGPSGCALLRCWPPDTSALRPLSARVRSRLCRPNTAARPQTPSACARPPPFRAPSSSRPPTRPPTSPTLTGPSPVRSCVAVCRPAGYRIRPSVRSRGLPSVVGRRGILVMGMGMGMGGRLTRTEVVMVGFGTLFL